MAIALRMHKVASRYQKFKRLSLVFYWKFSILKSPKSIFMEFYAHSSKLVKRVYRY